VDLNKVWSDVKGKASEVKEVLNEAGEDLRDAVLFFDTTNLSLEDCYHLIFSKKNNASRLASFDKKLQRAFKQHEEK